MPSSWTQNYYHMVFGTDRRDPWINAELKDRLYPFFGGIAKDLRSQLIAGNGMPDHVHLLIRLAADVSPTVLARIVRTAREMGIHAVEVVAIDDAAKRFCLKYGFTDMPDDPRHLYMPMKKVRSLGVG